jgi:hypothetical protein
MELSYQRAPLNFSLHHQYKADGIAMYKGIIEHIIGGITCRFVNLGVLLGAIGRI